MKDDLKKQLSKAILDNLDQPQNANSTTQISVGNNNFQIKGDVNLSNNKKTIQRINRLPESDDITAQQKKFIRDKIHQLADREVAKGGDFGKAVASWWSRLKKKFYVNSYTCLKQSQFDDVVKWIDQQVGITRSKLRRADKPAWRKEHYKALNAKCRELNQPKNWLYVQALDIIGKKVSSLKELNDTELKKLYQIIFSRFPGSGKRKKTAAITIVKPS